MPNDELLRLAERVEKAIPQPSTEPWRDHDGDGRPHPPTSYVQIKTRCGETFCTHSALIQWPWQSDDPDGDVMHWRFAPEPLSRVRAGDLLIDNAATIAAALRTRAHSGDTQ